MSCNPDRAPRGGTYRPRNATASALYQCADRHVAELRADGRFQRLFEQRVIERFSQCDDPHHGFARVYCPGCRRDYLLAFFCNYAQVGIYAQLGTCMRAAPARLSE